MEDNTSTITNKKRKKLDHHNGQRKIDIVQKQLAAAKESVAQLESLLDLLQSEEDEKKPYKLSRSSGEDDDHNDILLPSDELLLVLEWLCHKDVLACVQVCRRWQNDIDKQHFWKTVAENHSPHFIKAIEERRIKMISKNPSPPSTSDQSDDLPILNYKNIAKSLVYKKSTTHEVQTNDNNMTQLNPKDVFVLVEVRDKNTGTVIGVWHKSFDGYQTDKWSIIVNRGINMIDNDDEKPLVPKTLEHDGTFDEHFDDDDNPRSYTPKNIYESLVFSARCFRFDTGQSICWDFEGHSICIDGDSHFIMSDGKEPDVNRNAGGILTTNAFWSLRYHRDMRMCLDIKITPMIPSSDWQLNDWRKLRYRLDKMYCKFFETREDLQRGVGEVFRSKQVLLSSLDGLCWQ